VSSTSLLEQHRDETLAELGKQLRLKRQEQALSLENLAAKTRIQQRMLQALEEGELDELPEPIYIQGFIKQYAEALGLNGAELSRNFPIGDRRLRIKPVWQKLPTAQLRPVHLYLIYIFVIICAVNALSRMLSRSELQVSSSSQLQSQSQPAVSSAAKREQILPNHLEAKAVGATLKVASQPKPVQVKATLKADSWIRVVADGTLLFEGLLPQGTRRTWVAQQQLKLRAGNAGGVLVTFNQEQAKELGNPGEVQEVTFVANPRFQ
jgi:cytoskeletal protein RodZ